MAVLDAEWIYRFGRRVVGVDEPLLLAVQRAAVRRTPPEVRIPGAARAVPEAERAEIVRKCKVHVRFVDRQLELIGGKLVDGLVGEDQVFAAHKIEPDVR